MVVWISVQIPMTRKHALIMVGRTVAASRPARETNIPPHTKGVKSTRVIWTAK